MIGKYRLQGVPGEQITETERRNIRKCNLPAAIATQDGAVYGAIGGGVSAAGTSREAVRRADDWAQHIQGIQARLEAKLNFRSPMSMAILQFGSPAPEDHHLQPLSHVGAAIARDSGADVGGVG